MVQMGSMGGVQLESACSACLPECMHVLKMHGKQMFEQPWNFGSAKYYPVWLDALIIHHTDQPMHAV